MATRPSSLLLRPLPFPLLIALRYARSTRRDAFVSFLSGVAVGGISLGVAALILSLAALSGLQEALQSEILARTPQIEVELPPGADAEAARRAAVGVPGVLSAEPLLRGQGWLLYGGAARPVELVGFRERVPPFFPGAAGSPEGLYVASALAEAWALLPGDRLEILSARPTLTPLGPRPRIRSLPLAGTFETGRTEEGERLSRVALPYHVAESLLDPSRRRLVVTTVGLERALTVAPRIAAALPPGSTVRTWREINRPLFFALRLEKLTLFVGVFLIVVVAALALVADLALIVVSKQAEIGMLEAMGATPESLRRAFLTLGALLAGVAMALGGGIGAGGAWVLGHFRLVPVPGQVFFIDHLPFVVRGTDVALVLSLTLAVALICSFVAARRAAALSPVEAIRR